MTNNNDDRRKGDDRGEDPPGHTILRRHPNIRHHASGASSGTPGAFRISHNGSSAEEAADVRRGLDPSPAPSDDDDDDDWDEGAEQQQAVADNADTDAAPASSRHNSIMSTITLLTAEPVDEEAEAERERRLVEQERQNEAQLQRLREMERQRTAEQEQIRQLQAELQSLRRQQEEQQQEATSISNLENHDGDEEQPATEQAPAIDKGAIVKEGDATPKQSSVDTHRSDDPPDVQNRDHGRIFAPRAFWGASCRRRRRRRRKAIAVLMTAVAIALVSAIALGISLSNKQNDEEGDGPTPVPTSPPVTLNDPSTNPPLPAVVVVNEGDWVQMGQDISGQAAGDWFGEAVAISEDGQTVAVGARHHQKVGQVRVLRFNRTTSRWDALGPPASLLGETVGDEFGRSVSLSDNGNTVAVGIPRREGVHVDSGQVRVFSYYQNDDTTTPDEHEGRWIQVGPDVNGDGPGDWFGESIALSGQTLVAGARYRNSGLSPGQVRAFRFDKRPGRKNWVALGTAINGQQEGDRFGSIVAMSRDGSIVAVGAESRQTGGAVRVYRVTRSSWILSNNNNNNNNNQSGSGDGRTIMRWVQLGQSLFGDSSSDHFGSDLALSSDGKILAVGDRWHDAAITSETSSDATTTLSDAGLVRVFRYDDTSENNKWVQLGQDITGKQASSSFGSSVDLSGDGSTLVAGASLHDDNGFTASGQVRLFGYNQDEEKWSQLGQDLNGDSSRGFFGESVALSSKGDIVAVGAHAADGGNGVGSGLVKVFRRYTIAKD